MRLSYYPTLSKMVSAMNLGEMLSFARQNESLFQKPYITVARQPGSGGKVIAKMVSEKLGFEFVHKEIIEDIAASTKKRAAIIKALDEKSRSKINDLIHGMFNQEYVDDYTYIKELSKVMLAYMHRGHIVILGRAGNFISPPCQGLHVDIIAPLKQRVENTMLYEGVRKQEAKERVLKVTRERELFTSQYFKKDVWSPKYYDLTLNTSCLSNEQAADLIVDAFYRKFPARLRYKALFAK